MTGFSFLMTGEKFAGTPVTKIPDLEISLRAGDFSFFKLKPRSKNRRAGNFPGPRDFSLFPNGDTKFPPKYLHEVL